MPAPHLVVERPDRSGGWSIRTASGAVWGRFDPGNPGDPGWIPDPLPFGVIRIVRSGSVAGWPEPTEPGNWTPKALAQWPAVLKRLQETHSAANPLLLLPDARDLISDAPGTLRVAYGDDGSGCGLFGVALDPSRLLAGSLRDLNADRDDFVHRLAEVVVPRCRLLITSGMDWATATQRTALHGAAAAAGVPNAA